MSSVSSDPRVSRLALLSACALPGVAHAQAIPLPLALAAVSPLAAALLAVVLGIATRSWRVATTHLILLSVWVVLFLVAVQSVESDYVIWAPLVLYAAHVLALLALLGIAVAKLIRRRDASGRDG